MTQNQYEKNKSRKIFELAGKLSSAIKVADLLEYGFPIVLTGKTLKYEIEDKMVLEKTLAAVNEYVERLKGELKDAVEEL